MGLLQKYAEQIPAEVLPEAITYLQSSDAIKQEVVEKLVSIEESEKTEPANGSKTQGKDGGKEGVKTDKMDVDTTKTDDALKSDEKKVDEKKQPCKRKLEDISPANVRFIIVHNSVIIVTLSNS